ncbi:MAG: hypothetical protein H7Y88_05825 [Phycisphaerales bacterium]|nr:hypothetical protein [Phycisphaerales bacterium]
MPGSFRLAKWYLDCVTPDGRAFIGYWARLRWMGITLHYAGSIHATGWGSGDAWRVRHHSTLRDASEPIEHEDGRIRWNCAGLKVKGEWEEEPAASPPAAPLPPTARLGERTLFATGEGQVIWDCRMPRAAARLEISGGPEMVGTGYTEYLDLTIRPWQLPIEELRWGRFHAESHGEPVTSALGSGAARSVVWIRYTGDEPRQLVLVNGVEAADPQIGEARVTWTVGGVRQSLDLEPGRVLREGPLGGTALSEVPGVRKLAPLAVLDTYEAKWLSRSQLRRDVGGEHGAAPTNPITGWAVHEVVRPVRWGG